MRVILGDHARQRFHLRGGTGKLSAARVERSRRAREREYRKGVVVLLPRGRRQRDGFPGRIVAVAVPPGMSA